MATIKGFKGVRYNLEKIPIKEVVTQPYDKIDKEMQARYYEKNPFNVVRLILNKDSNPYLSAKNYFNEWLSREILIEDEEESIYPYTQEYQGKVRFGVVVILKVEPFSTKVVLPHERTFSKAKEDRLNLLRATGVHFGQIFMLYPDPKQEVKELVYNEIKNIPPLIEVEEEYEKGVIHRMWRISDEKIITKLQTLFNPMQLLIADGHHRYTTAINYWKEKPSCGYVMVTLISMDDVGLTILPVHRAIYGVEGLNFSEVGRYFEIREVKNVEEIKERIKNKKWSYGLYNGRFWCFQLKERKMIEEIITDKKIKEYKELDIVVLHKIMFHHILKIPEERLAKKEGIEYLRKIEDGIKGVDEGKYDLFFILNPTKVEEIKKITSLGELMPQKSTDFYPKLITGLVMYKG